MLGKARELQKAARHVLHTNIDRCLENHKDVRGECRISFGHGLFYRGGKIRKRVASGGFEALYLKNNPIRLHFDN